METDDIFRRQHQQRLNHMPWLYFTLKAKHQLWASKWQEHIQTTLSQIETVKFGTNCFVAENANIFAEPGRDIIMGDKSYVAANCYLHGPIQIGKNVSLNQSCHLEGGRSGIVIGDDTRIAPNCHFYAFEHGIEHGYPIHQQPITSTGIHIGSDVWIGAGSIILDGVTIADHVVIGANSTVTHSIEAHTIAAGSPAKKIGDRRLKTCTIYKNE